MLVTPECTLVVEPTHLKNMLGKLDHETPRLIWGKSKKIETTKPLPMASFLEYVPQQVTKNVNHQHPGRPYTISTKLANGQMLHKGEHLLPARWAASTPSIELIRVFQLQLHQSTIFHLHLSAFTIITCNPCNPVDYAS